MFFVPSKSGDFKSCSGKNSEEEIWRTDKKLFSISIWKCCELSKLFEIVTKLMLRKNKNWFSIDLRRWIERVFLSWRSYRRWNKSSMQILLAGIQPFSYLTIIYIHIRINFFPFFIYIVLFCWLGQFRQVKYGMKMGSWLFLNPFPISISNAIRQRPFQIDCPSFKGAVEKSLLNWKRL